MIRDNRTGALRILVKGNSGFHCALRTSHFRMPDRLLLIFKQLGSGCQTTCFQLSDHLIPIIKSFASN